MQPATEGLADSVQRRSDLRELLGDLQELPEDQRAALLLSSLGDLSGDDIAAVIGCPSKKVKALVFQARTSLMNEREARNTDCQDVREQLATLRGGALLRGSLRRHVRSCDGCRAFRDQTRKQREAMALLLPVIPTAGLKAATMSAAVGGSAAAGGVATATGGGLIAGLAAGGKAGAAKVFVAAAIAGGGIGAGVAEVNHLSNDSQSAPGAKRHHGSAKAKHQTSKAGAGANGHAKGNGSNASHGHGKPTTSPAKSSHAATGKGIAGTQPGHHAGGTGKANAPGQLKAKTNNGKANANGHVTHPAKPAHTAPAKPVRPEKATPQGQAKQQPSTAPAASVPAPAVTAPVDAVVKGNSQK
jgi:hypothetical protein